MFELYIVNWPQRDPRLVPSVGWGKTMVASPWGSWGLRRTKEMYLSTLQTFAACSRYKNRRSPCHWLRNYITQVLSIMQPIDNNKIRFSSNIQALNIPMAVLGWGWRCAIVPPNVFLNNLMGRYSTYWPFRLSNWLIFHLFAFYISKWILLGPRVKCVRTVFRQLWRVLRPIHWQSPHSSYFRYQGRFVMAAYWQIFYMVLAEADWTNKQQLLHH